MKALFEKVDLDRRSLLVRRFTLPYFDSPWHYHPEYELTYIGRGYGQRFVGDHIGPFQAGDLILIGPNLPHFWRCDEAFYSPLSATQPVESIVVQFSPQLIQSGLLTLPESEAIQSLFDRSQYGLSFSSSVSQAVTLLMEDLVDRRGFDLVVGLLTILDQLSLDHYPTTLASDGFPTTPNAAGTERMKRVLEYTLNNFKEDIRIDQIASVAGMAPAAFCRYFKKQTNKSFIDYLNRLRIGYARDLLANRDIPINEAGFECGFNNISHFHKLFKLYTSMTPLQYKTTQHLKGK